MKKVRRIYINNPKYPSSLKKIQKSPKRLFFKGKLLPNEKCFAIVGARNCTKKGKDFAHQSAIELSEKFTIVSGLALGIDTVAHSATISNKRRTIAVLGSGLNSIYPEQNKKLANQIIKNDGCLISEYPPQTEPRGKQFLERNRITTGLSDFVLAVNAKKKSGTASTIRKAQKQNKKVFVFNSDYFPNTIKIKNIKEILNNL